MDVLIRITLIGATGDTVLPDLFAIPDADVLVSNPARLRCIRFINGSPADSAEAMARLDYSDNRRPFVDHHSSGVAVNSFADSTRHFIGAVQQNTLQIPPPREGIANWPLVGKKIYGAWSKAHTDLPGFVKSMQPKIGDLAQKALVMVANIGKGLLLFLASFIVAGILMAYGEPAANASRGIFVRVAGAERGEAFFKLTTSTIRAVASGVIGVAFIQAILVGLALVLAGVPAAGVLAVIVLVLAIAQLPAVIVTLPAIIYIWSSGHYSTASGDHTYHHPAGGWPRGQRFETVNAGSRRRRTNAGDAAWRVRRHGERRDLRNVCRATLFALGHQNLHGLGHR
jgi:hypothetical protein